MKKIKYKNRWVLGLAAIIVLTVLFLFFYPKVNTATSSSISKDDIRNLQWLAKVDPLNFAYYKDNNGKTIKLTSGYYYFSGEDEGYMYINNGENGETYGELDNDGIDEAVTMKFTSQGGTGKFPELVVLKKDGESYKEVASISEPMDFFADRIAVKSIEIKDKIITVNILGKGPKDSGCCPTVPMEMKFKLVDDKIEVVK